MRQRSSNLRKNGRKIHTYTLFLGTTPPNPRVQRHLRELWVYRKPRTQDNSESQVLNSGRLCTSHVPESPTTENLKCLGFLNQETCPVCKFGDPPRGQSPHALAARSPQSWDDALLLPKSQVPGDHRVPSSPPCQSLTEDPRPKRFSQPETRGRRAERSGPLLPASAAMVQGADNTGRTTRQQHLRSAPACGLERRLSLPLQREGCTAYGARGGPNRTWHRDPPEAPPT